MITFKNTFLLLAFPRPIHFDLPEIFYNSKYKHKSNINHKSKHKFRVVNLQKSAKIFLT